MPNLRNRFPARRRFLKQSAALTASASIATPVLALAAAPAREPEASPLPAGSDRASSATTTAVTPESGAPTRAPRR